MEAALDWHTNKKGWLAALAGIIGLVMSGSAHASLIGATVTLTGEDFGGLYSDTATVGAGTEFNIFQYGGNYLTADLDEDSITLVSNITAGNGGYFQAGDYLTFTGLSTGDTPMHVVGASSSDSIFQVISYTWDSVTLLWNSNSSTLGTGVSHVVDLQLAPVPVPPALMLLGSGIVGMGFLARRKRTKGAVAA